MARRLKDGSLSEESIQTAVFQWIELQKDIRDCFIHIPNEGKRTPRFGAKLKRMGMRPGVSDIFITMAKHGFHGAWIELKSQKGVVSLLQKKFMKQQQEQGYYTEVCYSIEEAIEVMTWYCYVT